MPTLAAIDVGTNALRLVIGEVDADRRLTIRENLREPVRLGQDVFTQGVFSEETITRAAEAFGRFRSAMDRHGVRWTKAVATSAAREAFNRELFVDRVLSAAGVEIDVIGPEEEARLIHLAVADRVNLRNRLAMLVDIGGGSAEITLTADGEILSVQSYRMGAVRLLQVLEEKKQGGDRFGRLVGEYVDAARRRITREIGDRRIDLCVGTGGNIEAIGELKGELAGRDRAGAVTLEDLGMLLRRLQVLTIEQRIQQFRLRPDRADVILPAAIVLEKILRLSGVEELVVPGVGLKEGILLDMIEELYGDRKPLRRSQVIASALALGRKFGFDEQHGVTTARFAVKLFDDLRTLHGLSLDYRLLLETAALLHDIGQCVNIADHHKHTHYLLMAAPVIGLTQTQTALVANIARYHRKSLPKPQHEPYAALPPRERAAVNKLAALLRLADAMDTEHAARVSGFEVSVRKPRVGIRLGGNGDLLLERWALAKKSAMFEQVFGVKFAVEE